MLPEGVKNVSETSNKKKRNRNEIYTQLKVRDIANQELRVQNIQH